MYDGKRKMKAAVWLLSLSLLFSGTAMGGEWTQEVPDPSGQEEQIPDAEIADSGIRDDALTESPNPENGTPDSEESVITEIPEELPLYAESEEENRASVQPAEPAEETPAKTDCPEIPSAGETLPEPGYTAEDPAPEAFTETDQAIEDPSEESFPETEQAEEISSGEEFTESESFAELLTEEEITESEKADAESAKEPLPESEEAGEETPGEDELKEESSEEASDPETKAEENFEETSDSESKAEETFEEASSEEESFEEESEDTSEEEAFSEEETEEESSEEELEIDGAYVPPMTGLKAVSWKKNSVLLTWTPVPGAAGYVIYGMRSGTGAFGYIGYVPDASRHYYLDTKAPDHVYSFYWVFPFVWSYGKRVIGACPNYVYAIGTEKLPAVTGLKASSSTSGIRLSWNAVSGANGYHIYGRTGSSGSYHFIATAPASSGQVSWMDTNAPEGTYSFYWVFPYYLNSVGRPVEGSSSSYVYGTRLKKPAPPAPAIRALSQAELNTIRATYNGASQGYGAPLSNFNANHYCDYALYMNNLLSPFGARFYGDMNRKVVYLSFPCGWENAPNTTLMLDAMAAEGVKGVFYVTHEYASRNPALIRRIIAEGHEIGSHSYAHPANGIPSLPLEGQMNDALLMQDYMEKTYGYTMRKYNFESSYWSYQSVALMKQMGYEVCFYSFNYADYDVSKPTPAGTVYSMLMQALAPGCVYYLHPVSVGNTQALPQFIRDAKAMGYTFELLP